MDHQQAPSFTSSAVPSIDKEVPSAIMSIGRLSSMFSKTSTHIVAIILLAGFLPGAKAACYIDNNGFETCNGLSNLARALIGLAFFLVFLGILFSLFALRRRRNNRANLAYIQQVQPGVGGSYNGAGGPPPFAPQYPPPAHNGSYPNNYDPSSGFAPPSGAPPQYYAPPPGAPPITSYKS